MKKSFNTKSAMLCAAMLSTCLTSPAMAEKERDLDYQLFDSCPLDGAYIYSQTESSGASWVLNLGAKMPARKEPAFTPGSSLELSYVSAPGGNWKAKLLHHAVRGQDDWDNGVFIQSKPSPFKKPSVLHMKVLNRTADISALPKLSLLTSDDKLSIAIPLSKFLPKSDSIVGGGRDKWLDLRIPLSEFTGSKIDYCEQLKGIIFEQDAASDKEQQLFLDQIDLRPSLEPALKASSKIEIESIEGSERHIDLSWNTVDDPAICGTIIERSSDGKTFSAVGFKPHWLHRFADYIGPNPGNYFYRARFLSYNDEFSPYSQVKNAQLTNEMTDAEILEMVQKACARYYYEGAEAESGMTLESIPGDPHMVATGASGFGIYTLVVAAYRNFIPRDKVADRLLKILNFLEHADRFHGVFPHYMRGNTGHPQLFFGPDDDGGDLVETSFLMQGLLTARQYFDKDNPREQAIRNKITRLWEEVEWDWYRQKADSKYLYWHWSPDKEWKINHRLIGWNESMITYLLGIASPKHPIPAEMYYSGFASQEKLAQEYRGNGDGKMYSNGQSYYGVKLNVGGFSGGPIFFTHYNFLGLDPHGLRDRYTEYFENSKAIAEINLRYCQANPQHHQGYGDEAWGLTASDSPWAYNPDEPRAEGDKGKITPTGAIASMPYLPEKSLAALKNYYRNYGSFLWGEYGFRDAFSLDDHWVNDLYMGLNQGPMVVMIENYRSGLPWKLFGSNSEIKRMRQRIFGGTN